LQTTDGDGLGEVCRALEVLRGLEAREVRRLP
jgi:hypothetical protein